MDGQEVQTLSKLSRLDRADVVLEVDVDVDVDVEVAQENRGTSSLPLLSEGEGFEETWDHGTRDGGYLFGVKCFVVEAGLDVSMNAFIFAQRFLKLRLARGNFGVLACECEARGLRADLVLFVGSQTLRSGTFFVASADCAVSF